MIPSQLFLYYLSSEVAAFLLCDRQSLVKCLLLGVAWTVLNSCNKLPVPERAQGVEEMLNCSKPETILLPISD